MNRVAAFSDRNRFVGIVLALVSGVLFAFLPVFFRYANAAGATVITVLSLRCLIAGGVVGLVVGRENKLPAHRVLGFALMGALYLVENILYLLAIQLIPIATASLLLYLYPAIVTLLAWLFLRDNLTRYKVIALALAICGAVLTLGKPKAANDWRGVILAIVCSTLYSVYLVIGSRLQAGVAVQTTTAYVLMSAGVLGFAYGAVSGQFQFNLSRDALVPILALALFFTAPPILALFASIKRIGASIASIISTIEPVATATFGFLLFGERLTILQVIGGALVISAVVLLSARK
jgi:drug/metabolite transporter (DMT)-like permease